MPTYLLIDDQNKIVEHFDAIDSDVARCKFGDEVEVDGKRYTKMVTFPGMPAIEPDWAHLAPSIDPDDPDVPRVVEKGGARFAAFANRAEIENYMAKQNARPDRHMEMRYDFGAHGR